MLYKCDHCNYSSNRLSNLVRHQKRLYPCNNTSKVNVCNIEADRNVDVSGSNLHSSGSNLHSSGSNLHSGGSNLHSSGSNLHSGGSNLHSGGSNLHSGGSNNYTNDNNNDSLIGKYSCGKCNKILKSKKGLLIHEKICDGLDPKQCNICLKLFATSQSKWNHTQYVKCSPPIQSTSTNITNNIDNSINTNNNIQINIRADFDKISNEHIQHIVSQIKQADYLQMISNNIDIGKYVIPRTMEQIYFNDKFPEMQTLKKERRNDKLVDVHVGNGKWEKRLIDDISKKIVGRIEDFHTKYFQFVEDKYKDVKVGSPRWKQIMRHIKTFGNTMLWYEGFSGDNIENMGIQLNYPDEDDDEMEKIREKRNKEMEQLISEKVYEETLSKEKTIIT